MATAFSTAHHGLHHHHHSHHLPQHLQSPTSTLSTSSHLSLSPSSLESIHNLPTPPSASPEHFCKDCQVMFESSTSLEVHLSYHKENLLSRWASQDASTASLLSSSSSISSVTSGIHSSSSISSNSSSSLLEKSITHTPSPQASAESGPHYYVVDYPGSHYSSSTSDHGGEMERPSSNSYQPPPPVDHHHGHLYSSSMHHQPTYMSLPPQMYSPNYGPPPGHQEASHLNGNHPGESNGPRDHHQQHHRENLPPPPTSREPEQILDLDSHKVIYPHQHLGQQLQHPPQHQQQGDRNFYRPYLPPFLPPPHPSGNNGWPEHFSLIPHQAPHPGAGTVPAEHANLPYGVPPHHGALPPPPPNGNHYEIMRPGGAPPPPAEPSANPIYANDPHSQPGMGFAGQIPGNPNVTNGPTNSPNQPFNPSPASAPQLHGSFPGGGNNPGSNAPGNNERVRSPAIRSPPVSAAKTPSSVPLNAPPKTKGWKGGECKRPKTYNCQACNKWFTSSGHLKRHYGTTLHKNSIRQKGDIVEEPPPPKAKKSNANSGPGSNANSKSGRNSSSGGSADDSNENAPSPSPRLKIEAEDGMNNGKSFNSVEGGQKSSFGSQSPSRGNPTGGPPPSRSPGAAGNGPQSSPFNSGSSFNPPPMSPYGQQQQNGGNYNGTGGPPGGNSFLPPHPHHMHPSVPFSNGTYPGEGMPNPNSHYSVPSPIVPTTMYGGYSAVPMNGDNASAPLPPFSSVGFSHYDYQQMGGPGGGQYPPTSLPSPGRGGGPFLPAASPSHNAPNGNNDETNNSQHCNNLNQLESSFDSETNPNRDSPEELRSAGGEGPAGGGFASADGSLDGFHPNLCTISPTGSPPRPESLSSSSLSSASSTSSSSQDGPARKRIKGQNTSNNNNNGETTEGELLKCPDCSKTFGRACYLTQHANSSHGGGKPFRCQTCGKRFPEAPALSDHEAKHGSDKPYKCTLCPKQFNHKTDLRRHLCLHTGEKPFTCNLCGKGFIRKDHMTKHTETHRKKQAAVGAVSAQV